MPGLIAFLRNVTQKKHVHLRHLLKMGILMEERGHDFYNRLAGKSNNPDTKRLCSRLAEDELRHKQLIENILSRWLSIPIDDKRLGLLEDEMKKKGIFLNPPPPDSS